MAFRASLELNNKEFDVLYSNYEFSRNTDSKRYALFKRIGR